MGQDPFSTGLFISRRSKPLREGFTSLERLNSSSSYLFTGTGERIGHTFLSDRMTGKKLSESRFRLPYFCLYSMNRFIKWESKGREKNHLGLFAFFICRSILTGSGRRFFTGSARHRGHRTWLKKSRSVTGFGFAKRFLAVVSRAGPPPSSRLMGTGQR